MDRIPNNQSTMGKKSAPETSLVFLEFLAFFMNSFWLSGKGLKEIEVEVGQWVIVLFGSRFADFMMNSSTSVDQKQANLKAKPRERNIYNPIFPGKLAWNLKMGPWKRTFVLETIMFRFHVRLRYDLDPLPLKKLGASDPLRLRNRVESPTSEHIEVFFSLGAMRPEIG